MGASQILGAALEGALDDSENLIVICSPATARSEWVDTEVRHSKRRGDARVFAVIAEGEPNANDPDRECFPPALKVKIGADGNPTEEPDEPRAPDLRHEGMQRVHAQLAASLFDLPFDDLRRRDRQRALRSKLMAAAAGLVVAAVLGMMSYGWLAAQRASTEQARYISRPAVVVPRLSLSSTGMVVYILKRPTEMGRNRWPSIGAAIHR